MDLDLIESLTWRETEVLRLLDARLSNEEIAEVLDIPPWAVQEQARTIYRKLMIRLQPPDSP